MKKLFGLVAVIACAIQVFAAVEIGTVDDFINNVVADPSGDYILTADLTFDKLAAIPEFSGTLDGDGHKITGTVSNFMGTVTGTIKNLTIYGLNFEHQRIKSNAVAPMGGFALLLQGGTISNCTLLDSSLTMLNGYAANVAVVGFGGIVAHIDVGGGEVSNCKVVGCKIGCRTSSTSQLQPFGGIVGRVTTSEPVTISNCQVLNGEDQDSTIAGCRVGGILGSATSSSQVLIKGCYNEGVISNAALVAGGIMGGYDDGNSNSAIVEICNCTNVADITVGCGGVGGIFGYVYKAGKTIISDCVNHGNITSSGNTGHAATTGTGVGGIVGGCYSYPASGGVRIVNSVNFGTIVAATNSAGGIIGEYKNGNAVTSCIISNSANHASVSSSSYAGGMIGALTRYANYVNGDILVNCCQTGDVTADGEKSAGGLIGYVYGDGKCVDNINGVCQLGAVTAENASASPMIGSTGHGTKAFTINVNCVQIGGSATCANGTTGIITGGAEVTSSGAFTLKVDGESFFAENSGTAYYDQTGAAKTLELNKLDENAMTNRKAVNALNVYAAANDLPLWVQTKAYPDLSLWGEPFNSGLMLIFR